MGIDEGPVCLRHPGEVRMKLRTLHSDQLAPGRVLGVYVCPQCGAERRLPLRTRPDGDESGPMASQGFPPVAAV